jgi:hypothetical protein
MQNHIGNHTWNKFIPHVKVAVNLHVILMFLSRKIPPKALVHKEKTVK